MVNGKSLDIEIAGIAVRFNGLPQSEYDIMTARYGGFASGTPEFEWELEWGSSAGPNKSWEIALETNENRWLFYREDFRAEWFPLEKRGVAKIDSSEYTIDAMIRVWFSTMLLSDNGGLFHSAGLMKNERGFIFMGQSGAGKTTLSRKCALSEILSDELTAVRKKDGGYFVYGTPFMGELGIGGVNQGAPLDSFFLLDRTAPIGRTPVSQAVGAAELWGSLMCFNRQNNFLMSAMDFCAGMAAALPCERFSFDKTQDHWRLLL